MSEAQNNLAVMYLEGKGVEQNFEEARHWFQEAAEQGNDLAQYNLAVMYFDAKGVEQNLERTFHWLKQSAEQGFPPAQTLTKPD